ncbi:MAG: ABC transporter ATP-binding protein [Flavobacteriaceae bacterium]
MLRIEDLRAGYNGAEALHSVSISVREGTIVSIVGANGAGKSTLVNAISRMVATYSGSILFGDENLISLKPADVVERGIVQVPEGRQLFAPLTVMENLRLGFHRLARQADSARLFDERLEYVLSLFPILKERTQQRAGTMSGGEQQMLAMGRALMASPRLLLLDEPSLGLAPMIVDQIFDILDKLRKDGLTMLLVEQHADEALALADYGYVMAVGHVRAEGRGDDLRGNPALQQSYLGKGATPAEKNSRR